MKSWQQRERARDTLSQRSRLRPQAARRPAARRAGVSEHLLRRDVEPRLPDGLPAVQRRSTTSSASACSCRRSRSLPSCSASSTPLVTLESQTPVGDFDVFAFSVSFEWDYTNVLTLLRLAGMPRSPPSATARHPLVVIGGAVTFVNPEPLAPFADVIAAGEGEALVPGAASSAFAQRPIAPTCCALLASERGFYIPSFYDVAVRAPTARIARLRAARRHRRAAVGAEGGAQDHRSGRSAGDRASSRPTPSSARASSSKSCAAAPTCAASAGPATTTCRSARFRPTASSSSREAARAAREPRRPGVDRALRSPRHRAHPRAA